VSPRQWTAVALATAVASWPVWRWYAARLADGADEKLGLVAIGLAAAIAFARRDTSARPPALPWMATAVLAGAVGHAFLPPLVRAVPSLVAVALLLSARAHGRAFHAGTAALLVLGLPLEATLQFYAGYPLRVAATAIAGGMLNLAGLPVLVRGTLLGWRGEAIGVDAPCSGIHMLWVGLLVAAGVAAWRDLSPLRTALAALAATAIVVVANGARVAALFVKETGLVPLPEAAHEGIGLLIFLGAVLLLLPLLDRLGVERAPEPSVGSSPYPRAALPAYMALCAAAATLPLLLPRSVVVPDARFPGWPEQLDGAPLVPVPATADDERFARGFPGRLGRFTDGRRAVLLRWLPQPSRQLHPSLDCFTGSGYATRPAPSRVDARGGRWSCFEASRGGEQVSVCERIVDEQGHSWTDTSSWWWAAALGRAEGPYWAMTVVEPL
jgi:exosortase/archaeosortase family protein